MATLYEGEPDARQSDEPVLEDSLENLFRPFYRKLTDDEVKVHNWIKAAVVPMAVVANELKQIDFSQYALKALQEYVFWTVKGLTGSGFNEIGVALDVVEHNSGEISDEDIEYIASVAHTVNNIFCGAVNDPVQLSWDETAEEIRNGSVDGVRAVIENPNITGEEAHANWSSFKYANGWKHGLVKDMKKKEHPNLIAYNELSIVQRAKDDLFITTVRALLNYKSA